MDDTTGIKIPRVVCHALDGRFVFAEEGNTCQTTATKECSAPDARHAGGYRYACQSAATKERPAPDARQAVWHHYAYKTSAI